METEMINQMRMMCSTKKGIKLTVCILRMIGVDVSSQSSSRLLQYHSQHRFHFHFPTSRWQQLVVQRDVHKPFASFLVLMLSQSRDSLPRVMKT